LAGTATKFPLLAVAFFIGAFTVTGVPPFAGFWSKLLIITGALEAGPSGTLLAVVLLAESVVAFAWFLWVGQRVFFGRPSAVILATGTGSRPIETVLVILSVLCLAIPLFAYPLVLAVR